jgi:hypothetical protein
MKTFLDPTDLIKLDLNGVAIVDHTHHASLIIKTDVTQLNDWLKMSSQYVAACALTNINIAIG